MRQTTLATSLTVLMLIAPTLVRAAGDNPGKSPAATPAPDTASPAKEPDHITIQHVLVGFKGSVPGKDITRTFDEAKKLAEEIFERAKKGEDFEALVKRYTDDAAPGIYSMANNGVAAGPGEYPRNRMVPAFGDAGFPLAVGGIDMAPYDKARSPYGWHIVKRLK